MSIAHNSDKTFNLRSCRICLDSKYTNYFTLEEDNGWLQLFEYCFDLSLTSQDEPRVLCEQCAYNVKNYSKFKKQCHRSDKLWKSLNNVKCTDEKIGCNKIDELLNNEQNIEYSNNDNCSNYIKPFHNVLNINENSMHDVINNEIINENDRNENSSDFVQCDIKNSDILLNGEEPHVICIPTINEEKHTNQSIITKVKDIFKCQSCEKNYASQLWYQRHKKLCRAKIKRLSAISHNGVYISGTKIASQCILEITKTNDSKKQPESVLHFCGICKYSSNRKEEVNKHLDEHWTNNDLQCRLCEFIGKDQASIAAHRYVHYTVKNSRFWCHICLERTRSLLTLQFHYRKVHLNKSGGLCSHPQCDKVYNSWRLWKSHEKLHNHPGYVCDICGQKYRHRHLIIEHLMNHTNPPTYVCDVCGKTFLRLRNLRVHVENVHAKPEPIKCSHCNRMFKNQHYLRVHQRREAMDKVWKCEFCPMEYPMLSALNVHMKKHSEERPYCCHVCGSRYKMKGQLNVHMRIHTGCRPFKCVQCSKSFTSSAQLKTHNIIHTGILPYKCIHCEKSFRLKKRLMKHCAISHKLLEKK